MHEEMLQTSNNIIRIPTSDGIVTINMDDIIRVQAISNYSKLYFASKINGTHKTLVVAKVLRWFEENLVSENFVRVHRTHIVNKKFISDFINSPVHPAHGGKLFLSNGELIEVSKRKKPFFLKYWFSHAA
ncbi:MAG: LytTR family DNA-binding domain-containing protein [Bacteroidetes bacterium]|nr:LytTR family DNA-binding domain-containing protein [Bacteroidota bacterium]